MLETLETPDQILADLWTRLEAGVRDNDHPFRLAVTGTIGSARGDSSPDLRIVVIRWTDIAQRRIRFFTDRRSAKFAQLTARPALMLHFYDREQTLQLRIGCDVTIHTADAIADAAWATTPESNRANYAGLHVPGTIIDHPEQGWPAPNADGRPNFAVIVCVATEIDWLHIGRRGHRRVRFTWSGDQWNGAWVAP
ncbi:MAG: pyridoxamine 5'-phosphate oxidase family protein [Burkholderiales bacterium]|nr:pyridoxamine 5'-phosphate oxidase family protein [Phycisphaerae bacterium]